MFIFIYFTNFIDEFYCLFIVSKTSVFPEPKTSGCFESSALFNGLIRFLVDIANIAL